MGMKVDINLGSSTEILSLPLNSSEAIELKIAPINHEMSIDVKDFPAFSNIALSGNLGLVRDAIGINILSQRLIIDSDPLIASDIDLFTIEELDIGQNKTIYNV